MAKMTVRQLCDKAIENSQPFLGDATKLSEYSFMVEYLNDFENFDTDISENYGFLFPLTEKATLDETLAFFRKRSAFMIKKHSKELENLWKITNTKFDPAYNVEEHLNEEVKKTGSDTLQDKFAELKLTDDIGTRKTISKYGEQNSEQTFGKQKSSTEYGQRENETEERLSAFNSVNYQNKNLTTVAEKLHSDTINTDEKKDLFKAQPYQDEIGSEKAVDVHTTAPRNDEHKQIYDNTVTRKYDRQGNVGTMSTPELLQKAADSAAVFDFYNKLYNIILGELTYFFDDGFEAF